MFANMKITFTNPTHVHVDEHFGHVHKHEFRLQFAKGVANCKPWFNHALYRMTARVEAVFKNLESIFNQWFEDGCGHAQFTAPSCSRTIMSCGRT